MSKARFCWYFLNLQRALFHFECKCKFGELGACYQQELFVKVNIDISGQLVARDNLRELSALPSKYTSLVYWSFVVYSFSNEFRQMIACFQLPGAEKLNTNV